MYLLIDPLTQILQCGFGRLVHDAERGVVAAADLSEQTHLNILWNRGSKDSPLPDVRIQLSPTFASLLIRFFPRTLTRAKVSSWWLGLGRWTARLLCLFISFGRCSATEISTPLDSSVNAQELISRWQKSKLARRIALEKPAGTMARTVTAGRWNLVPLGTSLPTLHESSVVLAATVPLLTVSPAGVSRILQGREICTSVHSFTISADDALLALTTPQVLLIGPSHMESVLAHRLGCTPTPERGP